MTPEIARYKLRITHHEAAMSLDVNQILNHQFTPTKSNFAERDTSLYALSIGAASDPTDVEDLQLLTNQTVTIVRIGLGTVEMTSVDSFDAT